MIKAKVGDKVIIECMYSFGTGGPATITKITSETIVTERDGAIVKSTKKVKTIWCDKQAFSAETGEALNQPWAYYISIK